jgi:hypothetical protein
MKKSLLVIAAICLLAVFNFSYTLKPENQARVIVNKMINAINATKGWTFTMGSNERLPGTKTLRGGDIFTKVNVSPFKVYMKMVTDPNKNTEVLYVTGERDEKALVKPGNIFFDVKLHPLSNMLTKDQHHALYTAGFGLVPKIIGAGIARADEQKQFDSVFKYVGDVTWQGRNCYKLVINDPSWGFTTYKPQKGENIYSISQKLHIPEYEIMEYNGVKDFEDDLGGKTLKVTTSYAKSTVFYIDKENYMPIFQEMQDDKGVFERYEFRNVVLNPAFKADEFTDKFPGYNF